MIRPSMAKIEPLWRTTSTIRTKRIKKIYLTFSQSNRRTTIRTSTVHSISIYYKLCVMYTQYYTSVNGFTFSKFLYAPIPNFSYHRVSRNLFISTVLFNCITCVGLASLRLRYIEVNKPKRKY